MQFLLWFINVILWRGNKKNTIIDNLFGLTHQKAILGFKTKMFSLEIKQVELVQNVFDL